MLEWINEPSLLCIYTKYWQNGEGLQMQKCFLSQMFEVKVSWTAICMQFKDQLMLYKLQSFSICTRKGGGVYSKINEVLLHHYFLLQCTLCRINITPHSLHMQAYFFSKMFHSEHSYSNHRLLILGEIFDRIFSKMGNYHSFEMFWSFFLFVFTKTFRLFFLSHKRNYLNVMYVSL